MDNHFDSIADVYNSVWHFSDNYNKWMLDNILVALELNKNDILVDIGGGTGTFTELIAHNTNLKNKPYCVEPSIEMSNIAKKNTDVNVYNEDGNKFSERLLTYNKVLLKEVIHHINDRKSLWNNIHKRMSENGRILIVTRPQKVKLPLFDAAKEAFYKNQPPYEKFVQELSEASFEVDVKIDSYSFELDKDIWFDMIRQRFMSDLGKFTDQEIEDGINEIKQNIQKEKIEIEDVIIYITALK